MCTPISPRAGSKPGASGARGAPSWRVRPLRRVGRGVTTTTVLAGHRLVGVRLQQGGIIRRMNVVAIGTGRGHRVTTMLLNKRLCSNIVAVLTKSALLFDQQLPDLGTMGFMTGLTAFCQGLMDKRPGKKSLIMTLKTELLLRLVQQVLFRGVVRLMAT